MRQRHHIQSATRSAFNSIDKDGTISHGSQGVDWTYLCCLESRNRRVA
jgi:hypothetical protein